SEVDASIAPVLLGGPHYRRRRIYRISLRHAPPIESLRLPSRVGQVLVAFQSGSSVGSVAARSVRHLPKGLCQVDPRRAQVIEFWFFANSLLKRGCCGVYESEFARISITSRGNFARSLIHYALGT